MKRRVFIISGSGGKRDRCTAAPFHAPTSTNRAHVIQRPNGAQLSLPQGYLYVAETSSVKRYKRLRQRPLDSSILFDSKRYAGVGSESNVSSGENPVRAAINRYNPDGCGHQIFAPGTRNPIGLKWYPGTDTLFAAVQVRDGLGDDLVPDYFTAEPRNKGNGRIW